MRYDYIEWVEKGYPKIFCKCNCGGEIIVKLPLHKYENIPEYIKGHNNRINYIPESYIKWINDGKPKIFCNCKCGREITIIEKYHKYTGIPKYISGHNKSRLGIPQSDDAKNKQSKKMKGRISPNKGKPLSIECRDNISKNHANVFGDKNPAWLGGISYLTYCFKFNERLKESIRERDNRICQNCGKNELDNHQKLSVHHIHYDKENCYPDLISLCTSCNMKANFNREYWINHYMSILEKRKLLNYFGDIK